MATGDPKKQWEEHTAIVNIEDYDSNNEYVIQYKNKEPKKDIIAKKHIGEYKTIFTRFQEQEGFNDLFYGDNLDVLRYLLHERKLKNKIDLVYIDPPYATNSVFKTRKQKSSYTDTLTGANYLEFLRKRVILIRELLSERGSLYLHLDDNMAFQAKVLLDEIFGVKNFRGFITRKKCSNKNYTKNTFGNIADYILFYSKTDKYTWNRAVEPWSDEKIKKEYPNIEKKTGRRFKKVPIHAPGIRNGETGKEWKGMLPPEGKHWQYTPAKLDAMDKNGEIYWSPTGNPRRKVYLDQSKGIPVQDIWLDIQDAVNQNIKITGYPTEKNPLLLKRIIEASSNEGDLIMDCFAGSGTTLGMGSKLKRKWIGVDNSSEAINNILKRFIEGTKQMGDFVNRKGQNKKQKIDMPTLFEPEVEYITKNQYENFNLLIDNKSENSIFDIVYKWKKHTQ